MRRKDREVTCEADKLAILDECKVCRVALQDEQGLYIVPMNFGYQYESDRLTLYFHSAKSGRKITALQKKRRSRVRNGLQTSFDRGRGTL